MPRDLQTVLDAVLDGILVVDSAGAIERLNTEACRILEVSAEKIEGTSIESLLGPGHILSSLAHGAMRERRPAIADDVEIDRRIGGGLIVDVLASPLIEEGGGAVVVLRDHTMRNALQDSYTRRDELSSYGHIAAGIAHEVKNPLGGIRGAAELIAGWSEGTRAARAADVIMREVDRIAGLVDQLMVFARGDELAESEVNLHRVIDDVIELVRMDPLAKDVRIERHFDPSIPELWADADRLTQIFLNLARNALQVLAGEGGGSLRFSTGMSLDNRITDGRGRSLPTVLVKVADTGPGIPADVLRRLSTPFYTTRADGTGLGLAIVRHWVDRHGGTVRLESEVGKGTEVHVALPLRRRSKDRDRIVIAPIGDNRS